MDGGAWWATVHRVAKSQTQLWEELKEKKKDEAGFYAGKLLSFPELSSCQHHWLKINSVFKCDSFPQAFHKCKPDRFEEERELFLLQSGVLPIHCWRGRKKKKDS